MKSERSCDCDSDEVAQKSNYTERVREATKISYESRRNDQECRLQLLELELEQLKHDMYDNQNRANHSKRQMHEQFCNSNNSIINNANENIVNTNSTLPIESMNANVNDNEQILNKEEVEMENREANYVHESTTQQLETLPNLSIMPLTLYESLQEQQQEEFMQELCTLIPQLSPCFSCSTQDALLLISAIRNGGNFFGNTLHNETSLKEKYSIAENDKRVLAEKLERQRNECEAAKCEIAQLKERLQTMKAEYRQRQAQLSQRNEESRRELLREQTRGEKMNVRNRKLELEINQLKEKLRNNMHEALKRITSE